MCFLGTFLTKGVKFFLIFTPYYIVVPIPKKKPYKSRFFVDKENQVFLTQMRVTV